MPCIFGVGRTEQTWGVVHDCCAIVVFIEHEVAIVVRVRVAIVVRLLPFVGCAIVVIIEHEVVICG